MQHVQIFVQAKIAKILIQINRSIKGHLVKSLSSLLKLQFFIGFIGTLGLMPVLYAAEIVWGDYRQFGPFGLLDVAMIFLAPLLAGGAFFLTGLVAYPVLKFLQRRGIVQDLV